MSHPDPADPAAFGAVAPLPLAAFRDEVLALYAPPMRSRGTRARMALIFRVLEGLGVASTAEFTPATVARYIAARPPGESPNTTYGYVATLRALCNLAAAQGYCRVSPFALRRRWVRRVPPTGRRHHPRAAIARVLALLAREAQERRGWAGWRARRLHALAATVAYTGLRKMEAIRLRREDVDLAAGLVYVRPRVGSRLKTEAAAQPVPIPAPLAPILAAWLADLAATPPPRGGPDPGWAFPNLTRVGPWTGGPPGQKALDKLRAAGERAGVPGFTFLSLRHSWATHAEHWGLTPAQIQRVLRHASQATQMHYRHADAENLRASVRAVDFGADAGGGP